MGDQSIGYSHAMKLVLSLLAFVAVASAGRIFILDDGIDDAPVLRVRRDLSPYHTPEPAYHAPAHPKGKVGPVYTFVKTDPHANFKWGVDTGLEFSMEDNLPKALVQSKRKRRL